MFKKIFKKLHWRKDLVSTKDKSIDIDITSPWISFCMATCQRDSIDRLKRAKRDLSL